LQTINLRDECLGVIYEISFLFAALTPSAPLITMHLVEDSVESPQLKAADGPSFPRARRSDARSARVIYRALVLQRAFGRRAADAFVAAHHLPHSLWQRVRGRDGTALRR